jgi:glycosyltransferase involved in cell wall biosynthesis
MKSVSVVIPAYNCGRTIAEAIASVRAQTVAPIEIIVVDDCSQDDTLAKLDAMAAADLHVIRSPSNRGGSAARNRGIEAACADYVAFLDADDLWTPRKLELQLTQLARSEADEFSFSALLHENEFGEVRALPRRAPGEGESLADFMLKTGNVVQTSTLVVPAGVLERCRFNEELRRFQDIDFVLKLAAAGARPLYVDEPLVHWRRVATARRVSSIGAPEVLRAFMKQHHHTLTIAQRLGLAVRSMGPSPGVLGGLRWLFRILASMCVGALAPPNAASLILKHGIGVRSYGVLRQRLGMK